MKKLTLLLVLCLTISLLITIGLDFSEIKGFKKLPKQQRIDGLLEQEFMMTHDPATHTIPTERLEKVKKEIFAGKYVNRNGSSLTWEERGPDNFGGRTRAMIMDKNDPTGNTIFAGGVAGGLWKCTEVFGDYKWEEIDGYTGNVAIGSIAQDPDRPNDIYVGTGEGWLAGGVYDGDGIYKSEDGGVTFNRLTNNLGSFDAVHDMEVHNGRVFAATSSRGLIVSDDGGLTWSKSLGQGAFGISDRAADIEVASDGDLYAAMGLGTSEDGVYRSTDNGLTWDWKEFPFTGYQRIEIAVSHSNPNIIFALAEDEVGGGVKYIVKSVDKGDNWETIDPPGSLNMDNFARSQAYYDLSMTIDASNPDRIYIGGVDILYSSTGGNTGSWEQLSQWYGGNAQYVHADQHRMINADETGDRIIFSNDGGLWVTENGKSENPNVRDINKGFNIAQFYSCSINQDVGNEYFLGGTQDNGSHQFNSLGINSTNEITGGDGGYCHVDRFDPNIQVTSYVYNSYFITTNNWASRDRVVIGDRVGFFINPTEYDDTNKILYCSGGDNQMYFIDVMTSEYDSIQFPELANGEELTALKVSPNEPDVLYFGTTRGKLYRSENPRANPFPTLLYDGVGSMRNIEFDPQNEENMLITYSNFGTESVVYSKNKGLDWEIIQGNLPDMPVRWGMINPFNSSSILLATELGIWSTEQIDGQNTNWTLNSAGLPLTRVNMFDIRSPDNLIVAATYGRGMYTAIGAGGLIDFDQDGFLCDVDCNDVNAAVNPSATEIPYNGFDDDCEPLTLDDDLDQDGYPIALDCDDSDPSINPGVEEIPDNGIDENCDGSDSPIVPCLEYGAGPYDAMASGANCDAGPVSPGWQVWDNESYNIDNITNGQRYYVDYCQNYDPSIFEGQITILEYNTEAGTQGLVIDSNYGCRLEFEGKSSAAYPDILIIISVVNGCSNSSNNIENGFPFFGCLDTEFEDNDGDGYTEDVDCNDDDPAINPGAIEIVYNGIDEDCNPATLDDDLDQDGFLLVDDCDDNNSEINPGVSEIAYNNIDDDCNPLTVDDDIDQDGFLLADDCDDQNANVNPDAIELVYNGLDDDCNPATLDDDLDQDGFILSDDCDDDNAAINPDALEITYNGIDDDCNELTLDDDLDQDGFLLVDDCNDEDETVYPGAEEIPDNGIDEDCNGEDLTPVVELGDYSVKIYPNPATDFIIIETKDELKLNVEIFDLKGARVLSIDKSNYIDVSNLNAGVYILKLQNKKTDVIASERILIH